jgi:hypothetical protein
VLATKESIEQISESSGIFYSQEMFFAIGKKAQAARFYRTDCAVAIEKAKCDLFELSS